MKVNNYNELLTLLTNEYSEAIAFSFIRDGKTVEKTYGQFGDDIRRINSALLKKMGSSVKGRRVGVVAGNSYEAIATIFSLIVYGAIAIPISVRDQENVEKRIEVAKLDHLIREADFLEIFSNENEAEGFLASTETDRICLNVFTSGTSGLPKLVEIKESNQFFGQKHFLSTFYEEFPGKDYKTRPRVYTATPFEHIYFFMQLLSVFHCGGTLVLNTELKTFYQELQALGADVIVTVPDVVSSICKEIRKGREERLGGANVVVSAGAACREKDIIQLKEKGYNFINAYGMSENSGTISFNKVSDEKHLSSVGHLVEGIECSIIDGEICLKGPGLVGYFDNEEESLKTIVDGWLHTGDLGHIDEEGYLFITGRRKNTIILASGENVCPEELELELMKLEGIDDIRVFEKDDKIACQVYSATMSEDEINGIIRGFSDDLPFYKKIRVINYSEKPLPRNANGKLIRG